MKANIRQSEGHPLPYEAGKRGIGTMATVIAIGVAIAALALVIMMIREGAYL